MTNAAAGMSCPVCKVPLVMSDRQGIEIDYCPQCRGVWLDRGELDKIIERSAAQEASAPTPQARGYEPRPSYSEEDGRYRDRHHHGKRRKSFFEELFD